MRGRAFWRFDAALRAAQETLQFELDRAENYDAEDLAKDMANAEFDAAQGVDFET
jgi:hypothetical protein